MLFSYISLILFTLSFLIITTLHLLKPKHHLPPSPRSRPIIGHLHLLSQSLPLHHTFIRLAACHGPIFSLRFGSRPVLVVSSVAAAEECLGKNDIIFANRPVVPSGRHFSYNYTTLGSAPYGPHWRSLRRTANSLLFSMARVNAMSALPQEETREMVKDLFMKHGRVDSAHFTEVRAKSAFSQLTLNIFMQIVAGKRYKGSGVSDALVEEGRRLQEMVEEVFVLGNMSCLEDFFPFLKYIGCFDGQKKKLIKVAKDLDEFHDKLIENRQKEMSKDKKKVLIDELLAMQETFDHQGIKGMVMVRTRTYIIYIMHARKHK